MDANSLGNGGLGPWHEAEEAPVGAPLGDVRIHQVEEVSRTGVEPVARDGLPSLLCRRGVLGICAAGGALVLDEAPHGAGRSGCTLWLCFLGLPARWLKKVRRTGPCHCAGSTAYSRSFHLLPRDTHCPRSHQCFHAYQSPISKFQKCPTNTPLGNPWQWKPKYVIHKSKLREVLRTEALGSINTWSS